jgi:hypothetical protein
MSCCVVGWKYWYLPARLKGVTSQKMVLIFAVVETSNLNTKLYVQFEILTVVVVVIKSSIFWDMGRDSAVGIGTGYRLDD